uniref:Uncharacterized protein n=1 Tax=Thermococcus sp. CIR10 TaxID=1197731 RepID=L0B9M8_9EURY|nr:hypothetical protein c10-7 [Thermococcus sp. CIR10]
MSDNVSQANNTILLIGNTLNFSRWFYGRVCSYFVVFDLVRKSFVIFVQVQKSCNILQQICSGHFGTFCDVLGHFGTPWDTLGHFGTLWDNKSGLSILILSNFYSFNSQNALPCSLTHA